MEQEIWLGMMGGIIRNEIIPCNEIVASDVYAPSLAAARESLNIETTENNLKVIEEAEIDCISC